MEDPWPSLMTLMHVGHLEISQANKSCHRSAAIAGDAAATQVVLRRKTGELVAAQVMKQAFRISLADSGLQDLHVVMALHVEQHLV